MILSAYVKDKQTKEKTVIESDYKSKKDFAFDLRANGYAVIRISNKRDLEAQNHGFESLAAMKKIYDFHMQKPELWEREIEKFNEIRGVRL